MSTPLGHVGIGVAWALATGGTRTEASWLAVGAVAAAAADLDFLPGLLVGEPARFHHGASHSVAAMALASIAVLGAWSRRSAIGRRQIALVVGAFLSHLVVDFLTHDPGVRRGLPLAWPLSSHRFAGPIWLVPAVSRAWPPTATWLLHLAWLLLAELALVTPLVVGAWVYAGRPDLPTGRWRSGGSSR